MCFSHKQSKASSAMMPWQLLRAAPGYCVDHGAAGLEPCSHGMCLSREKLSLRQLNGRLASYLQQVQSLEAANRELECRIQKEMDRKCPRELRQLDAHVRTASLLREQISESLSDKAHMKLQLLNAEFTISNLRTRFELESGRRAAVEKELSKMCLLEEELCANRLPELQNQLNSQTQQLMELQMQHQQDIQALLVHLSCGIRVEIQPTESLDLMWQLENLRRTTETQPDKNQKECQLNRQVSMLSSPGVTFNNPEGSQVIHTELQELRRRVVNLETELTELQKLNATLEASGLEQNRSVVQQVVVLRQRADSLCTDLDSALQAVAQQAADHQTLLDTKTRLEAEIHDYRKLLDETSPRWVSNHQSNITSCSITTKPPASMTNIRVNNPVSVQGACLQVTEVDSVSKGNMCTVEQTPIVAPLSELVATVRSKHPMNSLINLPNLTDPQDQRTGTSFERTRDEYMTISTTMKRESSPLGINTKDIMLQNSPTNQSLDKEVFKDSKPETETEQLITTLVVDAESVRTAVTQAKPEASTSKQTTPKSGLPANKTETNFQKMITESRADSEGKQQTQIITHAAEVQTEADFVQSAHMNCTKGSSQTKNQNPAQDVPLTLRMPAATVGDAEEAAGPHIAMSEEALGRVSGSLTLSDEKDTGKQEKKEEEKVAEEEGTLLGFRFGSSPLSDASNGEKSKVKEDASRELNIEPSLFGSSEAKGNVESNSSKEITTLAHDMMFSSQKATTEAVLQANETNISRVISKTSLSADLEKKQGPLFVTQMAISDPSKHVAAVVSNETETTVSIQIDCTEATIHCEKQKPVQVVSLSLAIQEESVLEGEDVPATATCVSGSPILTSEEAQVKVSGDLTLGDTEDTESQENKGDEQGNFTSLELDQSSAFSPASNSKQNKVTDDGSGIATASSSICNTAQGIIQFAPETLSVRRAAVQPGTATLRQSTSEGVLQINKNETNNQMVIIESIPCVEPEEEHGPQLLAHMPIVDPSKQTAAELQTEAETVVSTKTNCTESSTQAKNQNSTEVVPLSLKIPAESVADAQRGIVAVSCVSGSHILTSEDARGKVSGDLSLTDEKDTKIKQESKGEEERTLTVLRLDQSSTLCDASKTEQKTVMETANKGSSFASVSSRSPESHGNTHNLSDTPTPENVKKRELEVKKGKAQNSLQDANEMALSPSSAEEFQSLGGAHAKPNSCLSQEIALSPVDTELSLTDQISCPVRLEEHARSPELLLSPNVSDTRLSALKDARSPNGEDRDKELLSQTEAGTGTTFSAAANNSGTTATSNVGMAGGAAVSSLDTVSGDADAVTAAWAQQRFQGDSGDCMVYSSDFGLKSRSLHDTGSKEYLPEGMLPATSQQKTGGSKSSLTNEESPTVHPNSAESPHESGRFGSRSGEWIVYGGSLGCKRNLPRTSTEENLGAMIPATDLPEKSRVGNVWGDESTSHWVNLKYNSSQAASESLTNTERRESLLKAVQQETKPPGTERLSAGGSEESPVDSGRTEHVGSCANGNSSINADEEQIQSLPGKITTSPPGSLGTRRSSSAGSGEWRVYGGSTGRISRWASSKSLPNADKEDISSVTGTLATSPAGSLGAGRFGSGESREWRVYGGIAGRLSSSAESISVSSSHHPVDALPSSHTTIGPRLIRVGSSGSLSSRSVVRRSSSQGSGGRLSSSANSSRLSRASTSGRSTSTGSSEWKPVYSPASSHKSSAGRSGGSGTISGQRALSTGGRMSVSLGSVQGLSSSSTTTTGGNGKSSTGSGSELGNKSSSQSGGRISGSPQSGRTAGTGGRVISSSEGPIRSTGSRGGASKERISVCKMAALSISAAGREKGRNRERQQDAASSTILRQWLNSGSGVTSADPDGRDDVVNP